jgi:hypothetical protein
MDIHIPICRYMERTENGKVPSRYVPTFNASFQALRMHTCTYVCNGRAACDKKRRGTERNIILSNLSTVARWYIYLHTKNAQSWYILGALT